MALLRIEANDIDAGSKGVGGRATLGEQMQAQTAQRNSTQTTMQLTDLRFKAGAASSFDVLEAQRSLFAAQQAQMQVQTQQPKNLVTLYKLLGGGWP